MISLDAGGCVRGAGYVITLASGTWVDATSICHCGQAPNLLVAPDLYFRLAAVSMSEQPIDLARQVPLARRDFDDVVPAAGDGKLGPLVTEACIEQEV